MRHLGLFAGIGGFELAARWMNWETVAWCEWNEFCQKVLKYHFPEAKGYGDITKTDFTNYANRIDILTGGFPCQPYSVAGKRKGKEDERHLWPEMLRAIREVQPRWIVGENVRGITNWNGGVVFDEVQSDLEAQGYEVLPFLLPACGKNAPHRRDRVWFVAYACSNGFGRIGLEKDRCEEKKDEEQAQWEKRNDLQRERIRAFTGGSNAERITADTNKNKCQPGIQFNEQSGCAASSDGSNEYDVSNSASSGLQGRSGGASKGERLAEHSELITDTNSGRQPCEEHGQAQPGWFKETGIPDDWQNFPTQSPLCNGNDGLSTNSHFDTISNKNIMDRDLIIKGAIDSGRLLVDFETGKIYSTVLRGKSGEKNELPGADVNGYVVHNIFFDGVKKSCRAHQIVWIAANGLYDRNNLMIDHIDRNRKNNALKNLRIVDAKGNRENATPYSGKLTDEQRDMIFFLNKESHMTMREIAEDFGISKSRVHQIIQEHSGLSISFPKWRNESIKAGGNSIVPQVVFEIYKAIEAYEKMIL
jgi:DNA (cytosine-5)-methyltransferase 1